MAMLGTSMEEIARCELAMLPILLYRENECIEGRDNIWFVDNTAALGGIVKRASGLAVSEAIIAESWMKAFALKVRLWVEYVDSSGNWSDGISREFAKDPNSLEQHFQTRGLEEPMQWFTTDVKSAWDNVRTPLRANTEPNYGFLVYFEDDDLRPFGHKPLYFCLLNTRRARPPQERHWGAGRPAPLRRNSLGVRGLPCPFSDSSRSGHVHGR